MYCHLAPVFLHVMIVFILCGLANTEQTDMGLLVEVGN